LILSQAPVTSQLCQPLYEEIMKKAKEDEVLQQSNSGNRQTSLAKQMRKDDE